MADTSDNGSPDPEIEQPEIVADSGDAVHESESAVSDPARVMRVATMIKELLAEARNSSLDPASRDRMRDIYDLSRTELAGALSDDLREELDRMALPFDEGHTERSRATGGEGAARGVVGGAVPRHPGHAVRQADGGPPAARGDAGRPSPQGPGRLRVALRASPDRWVPAAPAQSTADDRPGTYL